VLFESEFSQTVPLSNCVIFSEVLLLAVPGEFTTMAGRRLRETVKAVVEEQGQSIIPIIAGLEVVT
jgi:hypothetical protein